MGDEAVLKDCLIRAGNDCGRLSRFDLSAGGFGAGIARITDGGWSPGATALGVAAYRLGARDVPADWVAGDGDHPDTHGRRHHRHAACQRTWKRELPLALSYGNTSWLGAGHRCCHMRLYPVCELGKELGASTSFCRFLTDLTVSRSVGCASRAGGSTSTPDSHDRRLRAGTSGSQPRPVMESARIRRRAVDDNAADGRSR